MSSPIEKLSRRTLNEREEIMIQIKRVRDPFAKSDGVRFLVERLWPRGVKKVDLKRLKFR